MSDPVLTRHADGHLTVRWPDPPQPFYPVAHEVIQQWVDDHNTRNERDRAIIRVAVGTAGDDFDTYDQRDIDAIIAAVDQQQGEPT